MTIDATITTQPVSATVNSGGTVQASVSSSTAAVAGVSGGVGPQGPPGAAGGVVGDLSDVALSSVADGDVLRYQANKWRNFKEIDLTIDGGNF